MIYEAHARRVKADSRDADHKPKQIICQGRLLSLKKLMLAEWLVAGKELLSVSPGERQQTPPDG